MKNGSNDEVFERKLEPWNEGRDQLVQQQWIQVLFFGGKEKMAT